MTITARYPSRCAACGKAIAAGDEIEWTRGRPARHAHCPQGAPAVAAPAYSSAPSRKPRQLLPGEQEVSRPSEGRGDGYDVGATYRMQRVAGGGGPGGCYWTVVAAGTGRHTQYTDDTREGEWYCWAHVRPATDAEAAPVAERIAAAEARKQAATEARKALEAGEPQGGNWQRPAGSRRIAHEVRPGSMASLPYLVASSDGAVYHVRPVYDDSPIVRRLDLTPERATEVARAAGWTID